MAQALGAPGGGGGGGGPAKPGIGGGGGGGPGILVSMIHAIVSTDIDIVPVAVVSKLVGVERAL